MSSYVIPPPSPSIDKEQCLTTVPYEGDSSVAPTRSSRSDQSYGNTQIAPGRCEADDACCSAQHCSGNRPRRESTPPGHLRSDDTSPIAEEGSNVSSQSDKSLSGNSHHLDQDTNLSFSLGPVLTVVGFEEPTASQLETSDKEEETGREGEEKYLSFSLGPVLMVGGFGEPTASQLETSKKEKETGGRGRRSIRHSLSRFTKGFVKDKTDRQS